MFVAPETNTVTLQSGDTLVLCTDGLHDEMPDRELSAIVCQQNKDLNVIAAELVARAVEIYARWNRWACTEAAPTGSPPDTFMDSLPSGA
jgi:serine/threonine protein phosphatase PrpC